jgi:Glyoxalase-like domain
MTQTRSRLRDIVVDCARPSALAAFWAEVLGYQVHPYDDAELERLRAAGIDDIADDPSVVIDPPDDGPRIWFGLADRPIVGKNRIHLDINLRSADELEWLISLGARVVCPLGSFPGQRWTILADPEGNEFCAFPPEDPPPPAPPPCEGEG